jgi:signal transduction histidine kinase
MDTSTEHKIRPYARLLTMLGEQLIKNERIALIELIKNCYDADADWVKITFEDFDHEFKKNNESKIIIEDNGHGMTRNIIVEHWLNPATPEKLNRKKQKAYTAKGRTIQGEKGIGRFAMLKLGQKITVITRPKNKDREYIIDYDFSAFDNDFLTENGKEKVIFLEDLNVSITEREPIHFVKKPVLLGTQNITQTPFGTRIEIANIKGEWSKKKVNEVFNDTITLCSSFFIDNENNEKSNDFGVWFYRNDEQLSYQRDYLDKLSYLITERSVFRIENGLFDSKTNTYSYIINNSQKKLPIYDPLITGLKIFNKQYNEKPEILRNKKFDCGSFKFTFYIFDFSTKAKPKHLLDDKDKQIIKKHRIYLYRDDVRVYPYGEPDDDWLQIDTYRGTISAGQFLSNDQVVGRIDITHKNNAKLKDKTNREGLIEEGNALNDFTLLIQTFLAYIRTHDYKQYRESLEDQKTHDVYTAERIKSRFDDLKSIAGNNVKLKELIDKTEKEYESEKEYLVRRFEIAENLAGVGLSVETASHDINSMMQNVLSNLDYLIKDFQSGKSIDLEKVYEKLNLLRGMLGFIDAQLRDIQLLFTSAKQRRKNIRVLEILEKVERIYQKQLIKSKIKLEKKTVGSPLVAKATDAVLLQLFINFFDNSIYWLDQIDRSDKLVSVLLDGDKQQMIFSDNGPGVREDDAPYIFNSFYSGKGEEGRGLGLYIARQLLERNDYSIKLAETKVGKKLSGANFVVDFVSGDDK